MEPGAFIPAQYLPELIYRWEAFPIVITYKGLYEQQQQISIAIKTNLEGQIQAHTAIFETKEDIHKLKLKKALIWVPIIATGTFILGGILGYLLAK